MTMMTAHVRHLIYQSGLREVNDEKEEEPMLFSKMNKETILPILSVGVALSQANGEGKENWPKDFYEALTLLETCSRRVRITVKPFPARCLVTV